MRSEDSGRPRRLDGDGASGGGGFGACPQIAQRIGQWFPKPCAQVRVLVEKRGLPLAVANRAAGVLQRDGSVGVAVSDYEGRETHNASQTCSVGRPVSRLLAVHRVRRSLPQRSAVGQCDSA